MSFGRAGMSPSPFGGNAAGSNSVQTQTGPDLEEIRTEVSYEQWVRRKMC